MNREIKFRAWFERTKEMFNVDVLAISSCSWGCPDYGKRGVSLAHQPQIVVMQYTGLKDKNGREIYEGDMVNWGEKFIVVYTCGKFALKKPTNTLYDYDYIFTDSILESCEIIGNIHENKELLGVEE